MDLFSYEENNERSFSNPHPWVPLKYKDHLSRNEDFQCNVQKVEGPQRPRNHTLHIDISVTISRFSGHTLLID